MSDSPQTTPPTEQPAGAAAPASVSLPQVPASNMRDIVLRVPNTVTDEMAKAAWQVGIGCVTGVLQGIATILVPQDVPGPDNKPVRSIGQSQVLVRNGKDVQILIELGTVITRCNQRVLQQTQLGTAEKIAATLETKNIKEEALAQASAAVKGETRIITDSTGISGAALRQQPEGEKKSPGGIILE